MRFVNVAFVTLDFATLLYTYISRFSVNPNYISRGRKSGKATAINFIPQPLFNFLHKRPTFAFAGESGYTPGFRRKIAHSGSHAETGAFRMGGVVSLPSERSARSRTSPGRVSERRTLPLWDLGWEVLSKDTESLRDSDVLMHVAVPRCRGPAGLRDPVAAVRSA